jgi:hypothetical protein
MSNKLRLFLRMLYNRCDLPLPVQPEMEIVVGALKSITWLTPLLCIMNRDVGIFRINKENLMSLLFTNHSKSLYYKQV